MGAKLSQIINCCSTNDTDSIDLDSNEDATSLKDISTPNNTIKSDNLSDGSVPLSQHQADKNSKHVGGKNLTPVMVKNNKNMAETRNNESGKSNVNEREKSIDKGKSTKLGWMKTPTQSATSNTFIKKGYISRRESRKSKKNKHSF